jgi:hypothetical protein
MQRRRPAIERCYVFQFREDDFWNVHGRNCPSYYFGSITTGTFISRPSRYVRRLQNSTLQSRRILYEIRFYCGDRRRSVLLLWIDLYVLLLLLFCTNLGIKFSNTRRVLEDIGIRNPTFDDCAIVQHICRQVSKRAARLAGAGE